MDESECDSAREIRFYMRDCIPHLNYCFVARDDTILMEWVDFIGDDIEVWGISNIGKATKPQRVVKEFITRFTD
ncbi:hypothetical protein RHMOL_Rhmol01G0077900 [Rhododendron molle]|uniref:Uncharacterized protein n=1 Tax=Rhododendron molle TaxID=49168 RepID=A0ACC0Q0I3_RHOML|nr:hypothetical protein RHMOL_Rhmol01G0077900 [Rhododendron molle]